jgi:hypothetical protein
MAYPDVTRHFFRGVSCRIGRRIERMLRASATRKVRPYRPRQLLGNGLDLISNRPVGYGCSAQCEACAVMARP